jgi:hypothetical protein
MFENVTTSQEGNVTKINLHNENVVITLEENSFNEDGSVQVDYDNATMTEDEAQYIVNEFFNKLVEGIEEHDKDA